MTARIFILPTQYDIIDFRLGNRPENILVRDFESAAEVRAYEDGINAIADEYDRIENLQATGAKVTYTHRSEDPDADARAYPAEAEFETPAEAEAYCRGLRDAEGRAAPLLIDDTDDRFEQLAAWTGADGSAAVA